MGYLSCSTRYIILLGLGLIVFLSTPFAQDSTNANKQGKVRGISPKKVLGLVMKNIRVNENSAAGVGETKKEEEYFLQFAGKRIRHIHIIQVDFNQNINNLRKEKPNIISRSVDKLHVKTKPSIIKKMLFFRENDKVIPHLVADNVRYLRTISFIQDATIKIYPVAEDDSRVDMDVFCKDVFAWGGNLNSFNSLNNFNAELLNDNVGGLGNRLTLLVNNDAKRMPSVGVGGNYLTRNINGSFVDIGVGYRNNNSDYISGLLQEEYYYLQLNRPLASSFQQWTGGLNLSTQRNVNRYVAEPIFQNTLAYRYYIEDIWGGYNLRSVHYLKTNLQEKTRYFLALRYNAKIFSDVPNQLNSSNSFLFSSNQSVLSSFNVFRQTFYKTNFIYGLGQTENLPEGFNGSFIAGWAWTNIYKIDNLPSYSQAYIGIDFRRNTVSKSGRFSSYTARLGGYLGDGGLKDVTLLHSFNYFSRLVKLGKRKWLFRNFVTGSLAHQFNSTGINEPLNVSSTEYGLTNYPLNTTIFTSTRLQAHIQPVFYNTWQLLGFRFAPFVFSDAVITVSDKINPAPTSFFPSVGAGFRTRNENLIWGTIEVKYSYFLPTNNYLSNSINITYTTNLNFRFNTVFIKAPNTIQIN